MKTSPVIDPDAKQNTPADDAAFRAFQSDLDRMVETFGRNLDAYKSNLYDEASLRQEFLNPLFRALGWDVENQAGEIPQHREVEIESRTDVGGRQKRADFLFRTDRIDRFICEAKKPADDLLAPAVFQAKRYAWNKGLTLAVLTNFEELRLYVVGSKPHPEELNAGLWKCWHYRQFPLVAQELWDLLARPRVAAGGLDRAIEALPRKPTGKGKDRQQWLFKPDRSRALDTDFLNFLDEARRELASDLIRRNERADILEDNRLNEAVQRILDRLLFLRICEDRDIDTGRPLAQILRSWRENAANPVPRKPRQSEFALHEEAGVYEARAAYRPLPGPLWREVVAHFQALDRRPPSHIPFFNGNLFKPHFSEELEIGDEWLAGFLDDIGDEESPYLFNVIPVEILGTIYERFLGKVVRPQGRGVTIEEKPEVRKAGGVYYTPRYIVDYIVEQTIGKLLADRKPEKSLELRILDPACGSGSFLIRAFERVCEHWQTALTKGGRKRRREECWTDPATGDVHLTTNLKRRILTANIYGVDLDPGAVEVTQLSLYLKMLEGENRTTLARERDLFGSDIALLPPLQENIKCGNSLIASDFSMIPEDLVRVRAFDWDVQFTSIMKTGGFDAVVGNPPYGMVDDEQARLYLTSKYEAAEGRCENFAIFLEEAARLCHRSFGRLMFIIPAPFLTNVYNQKLRRLLLKNGAVDEVTNFRMPVFQDPTVHSCIIGFQRRRSSAHMVGVRRQVAKASELGLPFDYSVKQEALSQGPNATFDIFVTPGLRTLCSKLSQSASPLADICHIRQCIKTGDDEIYVAKSSGSPGQPWKRSLRGRSIGRYDTPEKDLFVKYGAWLARNWQNTTFYEVRKIAVRETGARITATLDEEHRYFLSSLYAVYPKDPHEAPPVEYLLALINSTLATWFIRLVALELTDGAFTKIRTNQLGRLPIRLVNLSIPQDRASCNRVVALVEKMLVLTPKMRAAKSEQERRTLLNAVTATDRQIDALVYELYGLTPEEIAVVEGTSGGGTPGQ